MTERPFTVQPAMTRLTRLLLLICLVTLAIRVPGTYAQDPSSATTRGLFEGEEILDSTLAMDVKAVTRDKSDDRPYRPATLSYLDDAGNTTLLDVGVKTRGHFRLHSLNCRVPPLRLNFKKKQVKNTVFAKFNRHKEAIYALVRNLAPLEKKVADRSLAYFEAFYEAIEDPRTVQDAFLGTCLKP